MGEHLDNKLQDHSMDLFSFDAGEQLQVELQSINSFYALAQESFLNKNYRIAVIYLRKILQIDNTYLSSYKMLAKIFQIRKQFKKAAEILRQAIDINFKDAELHYQLGYIYYLQGNKTGFARECTKALVVNSKYSKAYYALALLHFESKRYKKSQIELEKCLDLNPNDSDAHMLMTQVLIEQQQYPEAKKAISNVLRYDPGNKRAIYYLAEISFLLKDYQTALQHYLDYDIKDAHTKKRINETFDIIKKQINRALKSDPKDVHALMELASLYYQVGRLETAKKTLKRVIKYYPKYAPAHINYGLMLIYDDQFLAGIKIYLKVLERSPMNPEAQHNLAKAYQLAEENIQKDFEPAKNKEELLEIYMLQEKYDKAILTMLALGSRKYAKTILQKVADKNMPQYKSYKAAALFLLGEYSESDYILKAVESSQQNTAAWNFFKGLIEKQKGNLVEAYKAFEKTKLLESNYWFVDEEMLKITKLELKKIARILEKESNNVKANIEYLDLLKLIGRYKKALQHIIKLKKSDLAVINLDQKMKEIIDLYEKELEGKMEQAKPSLGVYQELAEIYLYKNRYNEAFLLLQGARAIYPKDQDIKNLYDYIIEKNIEVYEQLLAKNKNKVVIYNLAIFYAAADRKKEALQLLKQAVKKDKKLAIQARYEDAFKKYRFDDRFRLVTLIEGEDKNIYRLQD